MKILILIITSFATIGAHAREKSYFYCWGEAADFKAVIVKQVITRDRGAISSTFKLDIFDESKAVTEYWQDGDVEIGSDNTFRGPFKASDRLIEVDIKAPTFPDYEPRDSALFDGGNVYELICRTHSGSQYDPSSTE